MCIMTRGWLHAMSSETSIEDWYLEDGICENVATNSGDWCDLRMATTKTIGE